MIDFDWKLQKLRKLLLNKRYVACLLLALAIYMICVVALRYAGTYAESQNVPPAKDIIHEFIPLVNLTLFSDIGFKILIWIMYLYLIFVTPEDLPFALLTLGLFIVVRAVFFTMTIIGAPTIRIDDHPFSEKFIPFKNLYFTQDLFPSGHTGKPFVMSLIAQDKFWRYFFLISSIIMGITVLLTHVHYSIDIIGAFIVGYGVYRVSYLLFKKHLTFTA